jgi:phage major head subunit gpT-like protein
MSGGLGILMNSVFATQNMALTAYNAALQEGIRSVRPEDLWYTGVSMETASTTETELYDWLEQAADFREWKGERKFMPLRENGYALTNRDWDWGIEIHRNKFRDNQFLRQSSLFQMGGQNAAMHPQRQVASLLRSFADSDKKCWNGNAYFYATHPVDNFDSSKGTFSNRITNSLTPANFALARAAMMKFKDASGEYLAAPPDVLMVPPDLVTTADLIAASIFVPTISGTANTGIGVAPRQKIKVVECPELAAEPAIWYLARTRGPLKPVIVQRRTRPAVEFIEDLNSSFCKKNKKVQLGADYSAAFGWTFPQLMMRCGDSSASTTLA